MFLPTHTSYAYSEHSAHYLSNLLEFRNVEYVFGNNLTLHIVGPCNCVGAMKNTEETDFELRRYCGLKKGLPMFGSPHTIRGKKHPWPTAIQFTDSTF